MRIRKRIGALTLVLCLLLGMIPAYAAATETAQDWILGDINGDGVIDETDISILTAHIEGVSELTEQQQIAADLNEDGEINVLDLNLLTQQVRQGYCGAEGDGSNLTWVLDDAGTLTISGSGAMVDYYIGDSDDNNPPPWWYDYNEDGELSSQDLTRITAVVIESGVTAIGSYAFAYCQALTSVTIPDSVATIGNHAFYECNALTDVRYGGTETQWGAITSENYNEPLSSATIYYSGGGTASDITECHVFFDANGGGDADSMRETTVTPNENGQLSYTLPQCAFTPPDNLTFRAWQCTRYDAESKETVTEGVPGDVLDLTGAVSLGLTAQWAAATPNVTLASVTLNPASVTLDGTNAASVTATAIDSDGNAFTSGVTWSVTPSGGGVEITDEISGAIGIAADAPPGDYTVTATYDNVSASATLTVSRTVTLASVTIDPSSVSVFGGSGITATATALDTNQTAMSSGVTWSVSPADPATGQMFQGGVSIDDNGFITIGKNTAGAEYIVTATYNNVSKSATLTVRNYTLRSVTLEPETVTLDGSNEVTVTASGNLADGSQANVGNITWSITPSDGGVTFKYGPTDGNLTVAANATPGTYTITGTQDGISESATLTVTRNNASDSDILAQGYCGGEGDGTNLSWVLKNDGTLTVSGSGAMANYIYTTYDTDDNARKPPWWEMRESVKTAVIKNGVTTIGSMAFCYCNALTGVTIPDSVTSLDGAFSACSALTSIVIPNGVTAITVATFSGCSSLTSVIIPNSVTEIGHSAFADCSALTSVEIPNRVTSLSVSAFNGCNALTSVTLPNSVTFIDSYAFEDCASLADVYYNDTRAKWNAITIDDTENANAPLHTATIHCTDGDIVNSATSYTVTFDANGGAGVMNPVTVQGHEYTLPQNAFTPPARMIFDAWSVNGTEIPPGETISVSENITVKAVWLNPYRVLDRLQDMDGYTDQTWHLAGPLSEFQSLKIDDTALTRESDYVAEEGSTKLNIPGGTFARFGEGTHSIEADFQTSPDSSDPADDGKRVTSDYYTVKPTGKVSIDAGEITGANAAKAIKGVSYTGRFYTTPRLNDDYFRMVVTSGEIPAGLTFHDGGYFTGTPTVAGQSYTFTVGLQIRKNVTDAWPTDYESTVTVTVTVEQDTAQNVETSSDPGYELVERIPATIEIDTTGETVRLTSKGPFEEFTDFYIDGVKQIRDVDYTVGACLIDPVTGQMIRPLDGGAITGTFIQLQKSKLSLGTHSLNLEFVKTDPIGNKQVQNASQKVTVTQKSTGGSSSGGGSSGGSSSSGGGGSGSSSSSGGSSGGGSSSSGGGGSSSKSSGGSSSKTSYYSVKASATSHGKISLSATSVAYGKTVTVTVTPDKGYKVKSVSAVDSKKSAVKLTQSGGKYTFSMPKRAVTVSATFEKLVYDVSASTAQHGKITLNSSSASPGATVNGATTPDKGYQLSGVTVRDASGNHVKVEAFNDGKFTFLMPSGKATVSATFTVKRLAKFVDIQGPDWFFDDAEWAYNKGILRGMTEQYWEPQSLMSSVTSIVTLERLDGVDLTPYDTGAEDGIDNGAWYASAQRWARDNNILLKDRPFGEREAMTRGECAVMLTNYLRYRGLNVASTSEATFTDAAQMTEDELNAFRLLQDADVFRGYADGSIRPDAYLSRAHLSALLHRLSAYIIQAETNGV